MYKKIMLILCCYTMFSLHMAILCATENPLDSKNAINPLESRMPTLDSKESDSIKQYSKTINSNDLEFKLESILRSSDNSGKTLEELLKSAENNYALQGQNLLNLQAQKDYIVAKLGFLPTIDSKYNFSKMSTSSNLGYQTQNMQLVLGWNLDFAVYEMMREKGSTAQKVGYDTQYAKQNLYLQVVQQYYAYFNNESTLFTLQQKLKQIQSDVDRTQKLYDVGLRTIADLESLKSQASITMYDIENANLALTQSRLMLEYLTNDKIQNLRRVKIQDPTFQLIDRSDVKSLEFQIKALEYQSAQLHYFPILTLQNTYTYNAQVPDFVKQMQNSGQASGLLANYATTTNVVGISLTYQLFSKIGMSVQKQSLRLATLANEKNLAYKKAEQKKDEELYRKSIEVARNQIDSAKSSLISANLSYDNMKKRYDIGTITFTEYLTALSTKYDAESLFIQALNNYEMQKANYIFYSGQEIEKYVH